MNKIKSPIKPLKQRVKKGRPKKNKPKGANKARKLTKEQVDFVISTYRKQGDLRMAIICALMFQCLRVSDTVGTIKKGDIYLQDGQIREIIEITEQKTGKPKKLKIYDRTKKERGLLYNMLLEYKPWVAGLRKDAPMFYNQQQGTPLTPRGVNDRLKPFLKQKNIEQISCHSFRKAGGTYLIVIKGWSIEYVRRIMNHSTIKITMAYLDLTERELDEAMNDLII
jgi:site-specific recombinase XerD